MKLIDSFFESDFECIPFRISFDKNTGGISKNNAKEVIKSAIENDNNFKEQKRIDFDDRDFIRNQISINVSNNNYPEFGYPEHKRARTTEDNLIYKCLKEFFSNERNFIDYKEISNFRCFKEYLVSKESFIPGMDSVEANIDGWVKYHEVLAEKTFSEWGFEKEKNKQMVRYVKEIKDSVFLCIEYNEKRYRKQLKNSRPRLPNVYNLILFNEKFDKKLVERECETNGQDNVIVLGICQNPFFNPPIYPLISFCIIDEIFPNEITDLNRIDKYPASYIEKDENHIEIIPAEEKCEITKKYAYLYMNCFGVCAKSYVDYIEKAIIDTL